MGWSVGVGEALWIGVVWLVNFSARPNPFLARGDPQLFSEPALENSNLKENKALRSFGKR